MQHLVF